jgi:8-oxo-dGTP pyrophosphatase MutT (NUDIX family)
MSEILCSGAIFFSKSTKRMLFLRRKNGSKSNHWGIVGGKAEQNESAWEGLQREISEEIGQLPKIEKTIPLETFVSKDSRFSFHTFLILIEKEFIPVLNNEHDSYAWCAYGSWPKPLHVGLRNSLSNSTIKKKLETVFDIVDFI